MVGIMDQFSDSSQGVPDLEYRSQPTTFSQSSQDLVSLALETSKVGEVQGEHWSTEGSTTQEQLLGEDRGDDGAEHEGNSEEFPDEIECQLIQKNVLMNGQIQTIDFIMCNQCPRLFRTDNLLWNHINAKHKRRSYRRPSTVNQTRRPPPPRSDLPGLEPGEIQERPQLRTEIVQDITDGGRQSSPSVNDGGMISPSSSKKGPVYIVGLDKSNSRSSVGNDGLMNHLPVERYQRQRARKRIYVDSNTGPFKCPGCDNVTFNNRRSLDLHMKRVHKVF